MPKQSILLQQPVPLIDIAAYHQDAEAPCGFIFTRSILTLPLASQNYPLSQVAAELAERLNETDLRSALVVMARIEAAFRIDYKQRCQKKKSDAVSMAFRKLFKKRREQARLDKDILEIWRQSYPSTKPLNKQATWRAQVQALDCPRTILASRQPIRLSNHLPVSRRCPRKFSIVRLRRKLF